MKLTPYAEEMVRTWSWHADDCTDPHHIYSCRCGLAKALERVAHEAIEGAMSTNKDVRRLRREFEDFAVSVPEEHRRSEVADYDPTPCCVVCFEPWPCPGVRQEEA